MADSTAADHENILESSEGSEEFMDELDLRNYQLAYCADNFDISSCDRYAHFNQPFFKTILILRKFNIDILDILLFCTVVGIFFTKHLCDILEIPLNSVIRYYNINYKSYVNQLKIEAKSKKTSLQERVTKLRKESSNRLLTANRNSSVFGHKRDPSISNASVCDSEKGANRRCSKLKLKLPLKIFRSCNNFNDLVAKFANMQIS